jgi:hypothetical protein
MIGGRERAPWSHDSNRVPPAVPYQHQEPSQISDGSGLTESDRIIHSLVVTHSTLRIAVARVGGAGLQLNGGIHRHGHQHQHTAHYQTAQVA